MEKASSLNVNGATLAGLFSYTRGAVTKLTNKRILKKRRDGKYNVAENFAALLAYRERLLVERFGKSDLAAVNIEIRREHLGILKRRREQLEGKIIAEAVEHLSPCMVNFRNAMMGVAVRQAPFLVGIKHPAQAQRILEQPIRNALSELQETLCARFGFDHGGDTNGKEAPQAATEPDQRRNEQMP